MNAKRASAKSPEEIQSEYFDSIEEEDDQGSAEQPASKQKPNVQSAPAQDSTPPAWMLLFDVNDYRRRCFKVEVDDIEQEVLMYVPKDTSLPTLHQLARAFAIICSVSKHVASVAITRFLQDNPNIKTVSLWFKTNKFVLPKF